jgi:hypothetical protein
MLRYLDEALLRQLNWSAAANCQCEKKQNQNLITGFYALRHMAL